eukprot:scaffold446_cov183-Ochromonas_danica.AAC.2
MEFLKAWSIFAFCWPKSASESSIARVLRGSVSNKVPSMSKTAATGLQAEEPITGTLLLCTSSFDWRDWEAPSWTKEEEEEEESLCMGQQHRHSTVRRRRQPPEETERLQQKLKIIQPNQTTQE